jgi:hypothetical protein
MVFSVGLLIALSSAAMFASSHVRVVRLSYVDGKVQMERAYGQGLERAILNSPVIEGSRIVTGNDGLAEVEFENNATVRLGEATEIRFPQLLVEDGGEKINEVYLVRGTIYFDTRGDKHDINRVIAADRTFVLKHDSQSRFMTIGDKVQASVMKGEASLDNNGQIVQVKKNDTVALDSANPAVFSVAQGVDSFPLDKWNNERAAYQTAYSNNNDAYGANRMGVYGFSDLAYYGNFMNLPGYGLAWQPYGINSWMGWNPYMAGAWTFVNGFGYSWASAYPWGWMPYHYGAWAYQSGLGWFWYAGNSFKAGNVGTTWVATAPVVNAPAGFAAPAPPPVAASGPRPTITVGRVGSTAAFIPDGRVPPNFRSVINDRSSLAGTRSPAGSTAGGGTPVHNSRAVAPAQASQSGHVFATPPQRTVTPSMNGGYGTAMGSPTMGGMGSPRSSGSGTHSGGSSNSAHGGTSSAGHSGGSAANPK